MKRTLAALTASALLGLSGLAAADPVTWVWNCTLNEGVTPEQSQAAGTKWVAMVRELVGNDEISSSWVSTVVGDTGNFLWVDTYPSLEVWAAAVEAMNSSEEYEALEEELGDNETCTKSTLYRAVVVD